jgi:hypothetical protein
MILLSHLEIFTQVHTRIVEKQLKYLRYITTVQSCSQLTPRATTPYFQGQAAVLKYGI